MTHVVATAQEQALVDIVRGNVDFMAKLKLVRGLGLPDGCIGAGAIRDLVWNALHGARGSHASSDVDVVFFDDRDTDRALDDGIERHLCALDPTVSWEVTNQAGVHHWFEDMFGHPVAPLRSIDEAVASWPEFATCVALSIDDQDRIRLIAPHGLDDLWSTTIRRNPVRVSVVTYRQRIETKRYADRWPQVRIIDRMLDAPASQ